MYYNLSPLPQSAHKLAPMLAEEEVLQASSCLVDAVRYISHQAAGRDALTMSSLVEAILQLFSLCPVCHAGPIFT